MKGVSVYPHVDLCSKRGCEPGDGLSRSILGITIYVPRHAQNFWLGLFLSHGGGARAGIVLCMVIYFHHPAYLAEVEIVRVR